MVMDRFTKRITITPAILQQIAAIDEFRGLWKGTVRLHPQVLGRLKASVIITSTGASTRIEGARMTDEHVARFLRGLRTRPPKQRDEAEVAGYADALGRVFDHHATIALSESRILQLHQILLQFSAKDEHHRGKYKTRDNVVVARDTHGDAPVVLFRPTPPYLVKKEMDDALTWTNTHLSRGVLHPLLVIANFIFEFLAIHPFTDGNGRLSRLLTNLLLLRTGYSYIPYVSLEEIIEEQKVAYYLALRSTQKKHKSKREDLTPWMRFFLDTLVEQAHRVQRLVDAEQPERLLSERQQSVLALFTTHDTLSVAEVLQILKGTVSRPTVKQAIAKLIGLHLLERLGQGRATRYRKQRR